MLEQAVTEYLGSQRAEERRSAQQELARFLRWCGRSREINTLTPMEVEEYCGTLESTGQESSQRLAIFKAFLVYIRRQGWTATSLAPHAKLRRANKRASATQRQGQQPASSRLTSDGYQRLMGEMATLKGERVQIAEDIRKAAATKDFSENAPLDAAREHQAQVESRIRELETTLKDATLLESPGNSGHAAARVMIGSKVLLRHLSSGQETSYLLVDSRETNPTAGKISVSSPVGKALLNRTTGEEIDIVTPRGAVRYLVSKIGE